MKILKNTDIKKLETEDALLTDVYFIRSERGTRFLGILGQVNKSYCLKGIGYMYHNTYAFYDNIDIVNHVKLRCFLNLSKLQREGVLPYKDIQELISMYTSPDQGIKDVLEECLIQIFREKYKGRYDFI